MSNYDLTKQYNQYVEDVIDGKVITSETIKLACVRYKKFFDRDDIYFDYDDVDRRIRVVARMKHFKGKSNRKPFILLPYQQWIFASIFGFKYKATGFRMTKKALLFMARKSGKTALAAAICLTQLLLDNNNGQEIDFLANSGAQARLGFEMTKGFARSLDPNGLIFKRYRDSVRMPYNDSVVDVLNSEGMTLDGRNASTFIEDEFAAAKNWDVWNVMISSQGFQEQPLAIAITSANFLLDGYPCYEWRKTCVSVLKGEMTDDALFAALYELDKGDDWTDESVWIKANPSIGETITYDYLRDQVNAAKNQTALEFAVRTKHMNEFCQSSDIWITAQTIKNVMQPIDFEDFRGEEAYVGVDLSSVSDITSTTVMFPPNKNRKLYPDKFVFKSIIYLPASCLAESVNKNIYDSWRLKGELKVTEGNVIDYNYILKDQLELADKLQMLCVAYDAYNATQWAIEATNEGLPLVQFSQSLGNFNKPTKDLERMIKSGKCVIDDSSAVLWCFNNVKLKFDYNSNCKPDKSTREQKIDPVISMCEALGAYFSEGGQDIEIV